VKPVNKHTCNTCFNKYTCYTCYNKCDCDSNSHVFRFLFTRLLDGLAGVVATLLRFGLGTNDFQTEKDEFDCCGCSHALLTCIVQGRHFCTSRTFAEMFNQLAVTNVNYWFLPVGPSGLGRLACVLPGFFSLRAATAGSVWTWVRLAIGK
jgi:hypothetical protein